MSADEGLLLRLQRADLGYPGRSVLRSVDLEIRQGGFWFVLGPNGSGKSTLLRTLLGLIPPLAGEVSRDPERASRAQIGFVPQRCAINPALPTTVREFVSLGAVGSRRLRSERAADLGWALARVGLEELESSSYWSLSGGQRQRALVARALIRRPALLVLDEANEGLDAFAEEAFLETLDELHCFGTATLIFVTHRLELARRYATHVAIVCEGAVRSGPRSEVLGDADARTLFAREATAPAGDPAAPSAAQPDGEPAT